MEILQVFVVERLYLRREMYLSIMLDRSVAGPLLIASSRGGTSIEDVAATSPGLIFTLPIDMRTGITPEQVDRVVEALQLSERATPDGKATINNLWRMFSATDATMIEVNPLAEVCSRACQYVPQPGITPAFADSIPHPFEQGTIHNIYPCYSSFADTGW
jgi:succinyl-CoA synthetase beta subunit